LNQPESNTYFVFTKEGYDHTYYCVAGRGISLEDAICYRISADASRLCTQLNMELNNELRQKKEINESRSTSQGQSSS
jgi:hypothetical protein